LNSTANPSSSIIEIENKFFLRLGTNKTSSKSKELPDSSLKGIIRALAIGYLASSPSSTCTSDLASLD
jgi:hypothetical protein